MKITSFIFLCATSSPFYYCHARVGGGGSSAVRAAATSNSVVGRRKLLDHCAESGVVPDQSCVGFCNVGVTDYGNDGFLKESCHDCHCDYECLYFDDCCADAVSECGLQIDHCAESGVVPDQSCVGFCNVGVTDYGNDGFLKESCHDCHCDYECLYFDDCCADAVSECGLQT